jgi:serine/threonine-protein phosphatase 6 regulatory subunit 3
MGHITLLTEQILLSLNHFPKDLIQELAEFVPQPAWDDHIHGAFCMAKAKDAAILGGGKPAMSTLSRVGGSPWAKVDEQDDVMNKIGDETVSTSSEMASKQTPLKGEFKRVSAFRQGTRTYNADFGPPLSLSQRELAATTPVSQATNQVRTFNRSLPVS